ncbi:hypothetical protein [Mesorhizobium sp. B2-4-15]|nr:hypothetical protein [Mesorhizobium sp. B2-4-15]
MIHKRDVSAKTLAGHFSAAGRDDDGKEPATKVGGASGILVGAQ